MRRTAVRVAKKLSEFELQPGKLPVRQYRPGPQQVIAYETPTHHWGKAAPGLKEEYIPAPYVEDPHVAAMQSIVNSGMYKDELNVERSRHPRMAKTWVVNTDGSISDREFEFEGAPLMVSFNDRMTAHKDDVKLRLKLGRPLRRKQWEDKKVPQKAALPMCNAVQFPYCVPTTDLAPRPAAGD